MLATLNLLDGAGHDVWSVNTDPTYLEARASPLAQPVEDSVRPRMTPALAWLVFPLVLGAISLGLGLLVDRLAAGPVPGSLLLPLGFCCGDRRLDARDDDLGDGALGSARRRRPRHSGRGRFELAFPARARRVDGLVLGASVAVYLAYLAPVLLSGTATFAGYAKLDDTASWLALTDRILDHGRSLAGLPLSSYQATLQTYLAHGYPLGSLTVFAIGARLVGTDPAWVFQPFLAFQALLLALGVVVLLRPLVRSRWLRALAAFVAAQPALLYGYALWGSVKEVVTVPLLVLLAALAPRLFRPEGGLPRPRPRWSCRRGGDRGPQRRWGVWVACASASLLSCLRCACRGARSSFVRARWPGSRLLSPSLRSSPRVAS